MIVVKEVIDMSRNYFPYITEMVDEKAKTNEVFIDAHFQAVMMLSLYGFLTHYGENFLPLIQKAFYECQFYFTEKPLSQLLLEQKITEQNFANFSDEDGQIALFCPKDMYYFDKSGKAIYEKRPLKIFCSCYNCDANELLIAFSHEFYHLLKSYYHTHYLESDSSYVIRSGLHYFTGTHYQQEVIEDTKNEILDEVITIFQTSDIMREIQKLTVDEITINCARTYFSELELTSLDEPFGYLYSAVMFAPLWDSIGFKTMIEEPLIFGNTEVIENNFNDIVGGDLFTLFSTSLDELESEKASVESFKTAVILVRDIINLYQKNDTFSYKKKR